jgi:pyruvate dehydrogenase E2 component (dihydrolipoamide acetyltransferase)
MVREFELPDVGEGVAEGEIVSWLVEPGDEVSEDQPVAEVETDKAVVEVPSPVNGSVKELHAEAGAVVPVGEVIVTFAVEGEDVEDEAVEKDATAESDGEAVETGEEIDTSDAEAADDGAAIPASEGRSSSRVFAAPSARRLARELGVDIGRVEGSGPAGRVSEGDVRAAAGNGQGSPPATKPTASESESAGGDSGSTVGQADTGSEASTGAATAETETGSGAEAEAGAGAGATGTATTADTAERDRTLAAPATRRVARELDVDLDRVPASERRNGEAFVSSDAVREYAEAQRKAQEADAQAVSAGGETGTGDGERGERVPYQGIRRTIGQAMERSAYTAPHVTHHDTIDASALVETRERLQPVAADRGISLTYMPLVTKACVAALREFPFLNSSLDEDAEEIVLKGEYNIGVAVGTDAGLMVPVVEAADQKGMLQVASETNELVEKARDRSISREEMRGGTFTITNFGAIGGEYATPIINYPETAILGLGAIEERPVAIDGEVLARPTLPLSLSIDHRVIDGATAARFTNRLGEYLEEPRLLLLD